jgi:hypothetical protein
VSPRAAVTDTLRDVLQIVARYAVAGALFHSGMRMVLNLAGIHAGPVEWVTPVGEFSGAQYAGIWLGVSPLFQTLGGLVEVAAGLLLLSRRTTTLGAMIAVGCFTHSLMLHLCFRPSPWIGDAILLLPATYLVLLDWRTLVDLLLLDRPTTPISTEGSWETPQTRKIGMALKACFLIYFIYASGFQMIRIKQDAAARSDLSGAYSVASFSQPGADPQHRWRVVAIDRYAERLTVRTVDGAGAAFQIQPVIPPGATSGHREHVAAIASLHDHLTLVAPNGSLSVLNYSRSPSGGLILSGEVDGVAITADLRLISPESLPFFNHGIFFAEP